MRISKEELQKRMGKGGEAAAIVKNQLDQDCK